MNHPNDDLLLKSVLEILDATEQARLQDHLKECLDCRERLARIGRETDLIGQMETVEIGTVYPLPHRKRRLGSMWWKVAALLLIGFGAGYVTSPRTRTGPTRLVPVRFAAPRAPSTFAQFVACEPVHTAVPTVTTLEDQPGS